MRRRGLRAALFCVCALASRDPAMIAHVGEAIVLRSWPFQESDLLVTLFTRTHGKLSGVAKAAMRSRRRFGGALEPMTHVRAHYVEKPKQGLVRMDSFEILWSPLNARVDYARASALAYLAEVLDNVLPEHDPQDALFRLTLAVLEQLCEGAELQLPLAYFSLWATRLQGWLPDLSRCPECGTPLQGAGWYTPTRDGLYCAAHRRAGSRLLGESQLALIEQIQRLPLARCVAGVAAQECAAVHADAIAVRQFVTTGLERHIEHRLMTRAALHRSALSRTAAPQPVAAG